ncbi:unnamed protein product, partial [Nesidiocoris tenuis]
MDGIAKNWYSSTLSDLGLDKNFTDWETRMREAFKEHGWKKIREAYNFRYIGGPYVDYVLRKQSLLLEQEHTIDKTVQINLIVTGLPVHVQDKLDRSKIDSIEQLLGELRKIEPPPQKKNLPDTETHPRKVFTPAANYEQKKPCSICNKLGYPGRFHPEALCRNRSSAEHKGKHIKTVNNMELQEALNESITDQKKLKLLPLITFGVIVNEKNECTGVYDPGANISFITLSCVKKLKLKIQNSKMTFRTIGGRHGFAGSVKILLKVMDSEKEVEIFVVKDEDFKYDILL